MTPTDPSTQETASNGPKRRGKAKKKHTVGRVMLISMVVLAMVTGLGMVYLTKKWSGNIDERDVTAALGDDRPEKVYKGNGQPMNILVIGDDTREGDNAIDEETGAGSDTTILVHLSADRSRAYAISIPRDSLVDRPDCGVDDQIPGQENAMWNTAFKLGYLYDSDEGGGGGAGCVYRQLEATTGVFVDHYIAVDFSGFVDMVDAVGGIPVCVPKPINDPPRNIHIPAGKSVELDGETALQYVRVRYNVGDGSDLGRIKRQQNFIAALVNKVKSAGTLARLDRVVSFLDAVTESLQTDSGLASVTRLGKIAMQLQNIGLDKVKFLTVPNAYFPSDSEHAGRVYWTEDATELWRLIAEDKPLPPKFTDKSINAGAVPGATQTPAPNETESSSPSSPGTETSTPSSPGTTTSSPSKPTQTTSPEEEAEAKAEAEEVGLCA